MRSKSVVVALLAATVTLAVAGPVSGLQNAAHTHIGHVMTGFSGTPDGEGLLPTTRGEVEVIIQHLNLANQDTSNLQWTQLHAMHVLHAADPSRIEEGPGLGYGAIAGAEGVVQHIELAAASDGASDNVQTHAPHVAAAAGTVAERSREIADLAERVGDAGDYSTAEGLIQQMRRLSRELIPGADENGDGQIGWGGGEGGVDQVEQHMGFIVVGEGLE